MSVAFLAINFSFHIVNLAKVHLHSPEPSFYCYNFAPTGLIGKIQAPICSFSNTAAIGVQKSLLQFFLSGCCTRDGILLTDRNPF